jgi:serine/threonine-protein kinase
VEKAILWAMSLHPDNRPPNVIAFRNALIGKQDIPPQPSINQLSFEAPPITLFPTEQLAGYVAGGLFLIGLITTLVR